MFGKNLIRKQDLSSDKLAVQSVFKTIQGEGPLAGVPAIFIRLAGCNLRCTFCDTDFESGIANLMDVEEIIESTIEQASDTEIRLIVITGGEPLRQNIVPLIENLLIDFEHVQLETAGTLWINDLTSLVQLGQVSIVCSPKTSSVNGQVILNCDNWKYIIKHCESDDRDGLPITSTQGTNKKLKLFVPLMKKDTIWVQPCDEYDEEKNKLNIEETIRVAMKYGYHFSFQIHKAVGLP